MGATAENRLAKRRINELENKLKKLQRELQQLKNQNRKIQRLRKEVGRGKMREAEMQDLLDDETSLVFDESKDTIEISSNLEAQERCKVVECSSANTTVIPLGQRTVVICNKCNSRYSRSVKAD